MKSGGAGGGEDFFGNTEKANFCSKEGGHVFEKHHKQMAGGEIP